MKFSWYDLTHIALAEAGIILLLLALAFQSRMKSMGAPVGKYDRHEVISTLQKSIRRGDERSAVYWATALYIAGTHTAQRSGGVSSRLPARTLVSHSI